MTRGTGAALAVGALCTGACVAVFQVALLGKLPDHYDFWLQEYVHLAVLRQALSAGQLPLWNPFIAGGTPHLADPQTAVLYPITTIPLLVFPPHVVARVSIPLHFAFAGVGAYALGRSVGLSRSAGVAAGMVYMLAPHFAPIELPTYLQQSAAWAPWILWAEQHAYDRRSLGWFAAAGGFWALQLYRGYPQTWYFTGLLAAGFGVYRLGAAARRLPRNVTLRLATGLGLFALTALALGAAQLAATSDLLASSQRSDTFDLAEAAGRGRVTLFNLLGAAGPDAEVSGAFPGGVALGLGLAGLLYARGAPQRFFVASGVIALLLCLGSAAPLWRVAYAALPGFQLWHMPHRALFIWSLSLAVLAGTGVDALRRRPPLRPLAIALVALAAPLLATAWTLSDAPDAARVGALHLAGGILLVWAAALLIRAGPERVARAAPAGLALVCGADLLAHSLPRLYGRFYPPGAVYAPPEAAQWLMARATETGSVRFASATFGQTRDGLGDPRVQDNRRIAFLPPNVSAFFPGLDAFQGYLAIRLRTTGELFNAINDLGPNSRLLSVNDPTSPLLDVLGVRYFVSDDVETYPTAVAGGMAPSLTGQSVTLRRPVAAQTLEITSSLGDSLDVVTDEPVGRVTLTFADGGEASFTLLAGVHTAEWMYDAPTVAGRTRHPKAPIATSSLRDGYQTHVYRATFDLTSHSGDAVAAIRLAALRPGVRWSVDRVVLHVPLSTRFALVYRGTGVRIWENPGAHPFASWESGSTNADVRVTRQTLNALDLSVSSATPGVAVVNQIAAAGWRAARDGVPVPLSATDESQIRVAVPAGQHRIALRYLPASVALGAAISGAASAALALGVSTRRRRAPVAD